MFWRINKFTKLLLRSTSRLIQLVLRFFTSILCIIIKILV